MAGLMEYFARDYTGAPFILFGMTHLVVLALITLVNLCLALLRRRFTALQRRIIRYTLTVILVGGETSWHIWMLATDQWIIQIMLPLWLCSLTIWISPLMLLAKNQFAYEFVYFMGILGGSQAVLTPDLGSYGFPHFRFIEFLLVHGTLVTAPLYMTLVEGYRPNWRSLLRVALIMLPYLGLVTLVNFQINSNYLYTAGKLPTPSLLDVLGPWPVYIFWMIALAFLFCVLLYLPFALGDFRKGRQSKSFKQHNG